MPVLLLCAQEKEGEREGRGRGGGRKGGKKREGRREGRRGKKTRRIEESPSETKSTMDALKD